jgi:hypothetical protein
MLVEVWILQQIDKEDPIENKKTITYQLDLNQNSFKNYYNYYF